MAAGAFVGLDIGSNLMKAVEMRRVNGKLKVTALGVAPTPVEAFEDSQIRSPKLLGEAIKALLKQAGITARHCVSSVSGPSVVVRVIDIPRMNPNELAETMRWEVERHVPFAANEVIMDYQPISRTEVIIDGRPVSVFDGSTYDIVRPEETAENMEVLLAVAQQTMIDAHVEALFTAGLKPVAIDVEPLAADRCLQELGEETFEIGHTVAIINIGATNTDIGVFRNRLLEFPRTIPLAGNNLTDAIANELQLDALSAEQYKREVGEILLDRLQQAQPDAFGVGGTGEFVTGEFTTDPNFGGFAPAEPASGPSTGPVASPSGRMGFDFTSPGDSASGLNNPSVPGNPNFTPPPAGGDHPSTMGTDSFAPPSAVPGADTFSFGAGPGLGAAPSFTQPAPGLDSTGGFAPAGPGMNPNDSVQYAAPESTNAPMGGGASPDSFAFGSATETADLPANPEHYSEDDAKVQVFNAMAPVLSELAEELRRSVDFYRGRAADSVIHEVILVGGTSKLKNLAPYLEMELGLPVRVGIPFSHIEVTSKVLTTDQIEDIAPVFPVAVGLAAREFMALPPGEKKRKASPKKSKTLVGPDAGTKKPGPFAGLFNKK